VIVRGLHSGRDCLIEAPFFIDAAPHGALLDLAGVEHVTGAESQAETGEPHALEQADPRNQQAITVCFAMDHRPGEDHTIDKPRQYELWRDHQPPGWPGPLLSWTTVHPETHEPLTRHLFEAEKDQTAAARTSKPSGADQRSLDAVSAAAITKIVPGRRVDGDVHRQFKYAVDHFDLLNPLTLLRTLEIS
jgi:hypothetical protein